MTTIANWSLSLPQPQNETGRLLRGRQPAGKSFRQFDAA